MTTQPKTYRSRTRTAALVLVTCVGAASCDHTSSGAGEAPGSPASAHTVGKADATTSTAPPPASATSTAAAATTKTTTQTAGGEESPHERLYGTWVARDVDTKMGEVKIQLTFKQEGPVKILAWSDLPFVGQVRNKRAAYEVHGNTISSDAIRGGTSVKYRFDGGDLIIEYQDGKTVRFKRQT